MTRLEREYARNLRVRAIQAFFEKSVTDYIAKNGDSPSLVIKTGLETMFDAMIAMSDSQVAGIIASDVFGAVRSKHLLHDMVSRILVDIEPPVAEGWPESRPIV